MGLSQHCGDNGVASKHHDSLVRYYGWFLAEYNRTGMADFPSNYGDWEPPVCN